MLFCVLFKFLKGGKKNNKSLLVFLHGVFSELEFHSPNNFAFYDELFLKYSYSERLLAIISRAMEKPY